MEIVHSDTIIELKPGEKPNYDQGNPLYSLQSIIQKIPLAAEREHYLPQSIQYLLPYSHLSLYPYNKPADRALEEERAKPDFQHQNIKAVKYSDIRLARGWANLNGQTFPFLRIAYRGGPDSLLSRTSNHSLTDHIKLWIKVGDNAVKKYLTLPYNSASDFYEIELWGYKGDDPSNHLDTKGKKSLDSGELQIRPDLMIGNIEDFLRDGLEQKEVCEMFIDNCMHPILPLKVRVAFTDHTETFWDSLNAADYHFEFNMIYRGWDNYLKAGTHRNPHGGTGVIHFRTLLSNYWGYPGQDKEKYKEYSTISQNMQHWMRDSYDNKPPKKEVENFFKVDYMDMHILKPDCAIGLHRHRDNQEVFFMQEGEGLMVIGDWAKMDNRERCMEVRTLKAGHFVMLKGGNLHALINTQPDPAMLFIFGGYD